MGKGKRNQKAKAAAGRKKKDDSKPAAAASPEVAAAAAATAEPAAPAPAAAAGASGAVSATTATAAPDLPAPATSTPAAAGAGADGGAAAGAGAAGADDAATGRGGDIAFADADEAAEKDEGSVERLIAGITATSATHDARVHANAKDIAINNVTLNLFGAELLQDTDLTLNWGQRYGLLGPNGCGKSTLMHALGRRMLPIPKNIDSFHLSAEVEASDKSALQAVMEVDTERLELEKEADEIGDMLDDPEMGEEYTERLNDIYERLDEMEAATAESRAAQILMGLGFTKHMQAMKTREFSGGWRMRIALARALFLKPSLLLLDEPTNHLDMEAVVWLEGYLAKFNKILLLVSHSQDFLNNVCTNVIHMHERKLAYYGGNYDQYMTTRKEKETQQMKRYEWEQEQIRHMKEYIARFGHGSAKLAKQAQSKEKTLAKMERGGLTEKVVADQTISMKFADCGTLPPPVLQLKDLSFGYSADKMLYKNVFFDADLDSRIALVGPNGAGKTTLLKLICGDLMPTDGTVKSHQHLQIARYTQHFMDSLDVSQAPLEYIMKLHPGKSKEEMRSYLGRFGVSGDKQTSKMAFMSDGLKSRVVFALMAFKNPHMLLLDEPTNHLDIETIDALANALNEYKGGVILVSHDMRLIDQVAKQIYECDNKSVTLFRGGIAAYKAMLKTKIAKLQKAAETDA